jgi:hypothetical protein
MNSRDLPGPRYHSAGSAAGSTAIAHGAVVASGARTARSPEAKVLVPQKLSVYGRLFLFVLTSMLCSEVTWHLYAQEPLGGSALRALPSPPGGQASPHCRLRTSLKHGLADEAKVALEELSETPTDDHLGRWSHGRLMWYESLCQRLGRDNQTADGTALAAIREGIPELSEYSEIFRAEAEAWAWLPATGKTRTNPAVQAARRPFLLATHADGDDPIWVVQGIVNEIRDSLSKQPSLAISDRVRLATWQLLLGEYAAAHPEISLPTTAIGALDAGRQELARIEALIDESPGLEDEISADPSLAIRLDTVRVRTVAYRRREDLAREQEVQRLHHLRKAVSSYRSLSESLMRWQMHRELGDALQTLAAAKESLQQLEAVYEVVNSRRDYHLFDDEPAIEGSGEFAVVEIAPVPYSTDALSMLKSLQGIAYFSLLRTHVKDDADLLRRAQTWAAAALHDSDGPLEVPEGADQDNVLAKWVLALVEEAHGDSLAMSADENERSKAEKHFAEARRLLKETEASCVEKRVDADAKIIIDLAERLAALESHEPLVARARAFVAVGDIREARRCLDAASRRHRTASTVLESLRVGLRHGHPLDSLRDDWQEAVDASIIQEESLEAQLLLGELRNRQAGQALAHPVGASPAGVIAELNLTTESLSRRCDDAQLPKVARAAAKATYSLAFAQKWAISPSATLSQNDIAEAYRHARDAEFTLVEELRTVANRDAEEVLAIRESLVSARMAAGHLAALHLEPWQDDSRVFFFAAAEEAARFDTTTPVLPLLARPLLTLVFDRSDSGASKLAAVERQRRQMITQCLEAVFAAEFGSPGAGSDAMTAAAAMAGEREAVAGEGVSLEPSALSAAADGFDSKVSLADTVRAFGVLTDIRAGKYSEALSKSLPLAAGRDIRFESSSVTPEDMAICIRATQSPLVAFTLAKSIEAYSISLPLTKDLDYRQRLTGYAKDAYRRGMQLLEAERLAIRYPHLLKLLTDSLERLDAADDAVAAAEAALARQEYAAALCAAESGLALHPRNTKLWRLYFTSRMAIPNRREASDLLAELDTVVIAGLVPAFEHRLLRGELLERAGKLTAAKAQYELAQAAATTAVGRVEALSSTARVRAKTAASVP